MPCSGTRRLPALSHLVRISRRLWQRKRDLCFFSWPRPFNLTQRGRKHARHRVLKLSQRTCAQTSSFRKTRNGLFPLLSIFAVAEAKKTTVKAVSRSVFVRKCSHKVLASVIVRSECRFLFLLISLHGVRGKKTENQPTAATRLPCTLSSHHSPHLSLRLPDRTARSKSSRNLRLLLSFRNTADVPDGQLLQNIRADANLSPRQSNRTQ